ncbi:hypothetical protein B0H12DRAFT_1077792 [Mycena haematopus]|nr:hypothetical protein B0H12DRAFT_1077792 [Mycena haematopus]
MTGGRPSPFSTEQNAHITSFYPTLLLAAASSSPDELKSWKKQTVQEILNSPLFEGKLPAKSQDPVENTKSWTKASAKITFKYLLILSLILSNYVDRHAKVKITAEPETAAQPKTAVDHKTSAGTTVDHKTSAETAVNSKTSAETTVDPKTSAETAVDPKPSAETTVDLKTSAEIKMTAKLNDTAETKMISTPSPAASNSLLSFSPSFCPLNGVALFERERRQSITASASERVHKSHARMAACYPACLMEMWDALDEATREAYTVTASKMVPNVASNQADFVGAMTHVLTDICRGGKLGGGVEMMLFYAYREYDGDLRAGTIHAHSSETVSDMADETSNWDSNFEIPWKAFADLAIPFPMDRTGTLIPRNWQGIPVFPLLNLKQQTVEEIADIMTQYLGQLWARSWDTDLPQWAGIAQNPDMYYDTRKFSLPVKIFRAPDSLSAVEIFALAEYFGVRSSDPFVFRDKEEAARWHEVPIRTDNAGTKRKRASPKTDGTSVPDGLDVANSKTTIMKQGRKQRHVASPIFTMGKMRHLSNVFAIVARQVYNSEPK